MVRLGWFSGDWPQEFESHFFISIWDINPCYIRAFIWEREGMRPVHSAKIENTREPMPTEYMFIDEIVYSSWGWRINALTQNGIFRSFGLWDSFEVIKEDGTVETYSLNVDCENEFIWPYIAELLRERFARITHNEHDVLRIELPVIDGRPYDSDRLWQIIPESEEFEFDKSSKRLISAENNKYFSLSDETLVFIIARGMNWRGQEIWDFENAQVGGIELLNDGRTYQSVYLFNMDENDFVRIAVAFLSVNFGRNLAIFDSFENETIYFFQNGEKQRLFVTPNAVNVAEQMEIGTGFLYGTNLSGKVDYILPLFSVSNVTQFEQTPVFIPLEGLIEDWATWDISSWLVNSPRLGDLRIIFGPVVSGRGSVTPLSIASSTVSQENWLSERGRTFHINRETNSYTLNKFQYIDGQLTVGRDIRTSSTLWRNDWVVAFLRYDMVRDVLVLKAYQ